MSRDKLLYDNVKKHPVRAVETWFSSDLNRGCKFHRANGDQLKNSKDILSSLKTDGYVEGVLAER